MYNPNFNNGYNNGGYGRNMYSQYFNGQPNGIPKMTNPLTQEQIELLKQKNSVIDFNLTSEEIAKATCTHVDPMTGQSALRIDTENDLFYCPICGEKIYSIDKFSDEKLQDAIDTVSDCSQWFKFYNQISRTFPDGPAQEISMMTPIINKFATAFRMVRRDVEKITGGYNSQSQNTRGSALGMMQNIISNYGNSFAPGGYSQGWAGNSYANGPAYNDYSWNNQQNGMPYNNGQPNGWGNQGYPQQQNGWVNQNYQQNGMPYNNGQPNGWGNQGYPQQQNGWVNQNYQQNGMPYNNGGQVYNNVQTAQNGTNPMDISSANNTNSTQNNKDIEQSKSFEI
jgi:hypothetical protein